MYRYVRYSDIAKSLSDVVPILITADNYRYLLPVYSLGLAPPVAAAGAPGGPARVPKRPGAMPPFALFSQVSS